jgi:hypothetical protein
MVLDFRSNRLTDVEPKPEPGNVKASKPTNWMQYFALRLFCFWLLSAWPDRE